MSNLSHVDISLPFNGRDGDDYEPGVPQPEKRKAERKGKPRAAQFDSLDARLYAIRQRASREWQERGAA